MKFTETTKSKGNHSASRNTTLESITIPLQDEIDLTLPMEWHLPANNESMQSENFLVFDLGRTEKESNDRIYPSTPGRIHPVMEESKNVQEVPNDAELRMEVDLQMQMDMEQGNLPDSITQDLTLLPMPGGGIEGDAMMGGGAGANDEEEAIPGGWQRWLTHAATPPMTVHLPPLPDQPASPLTRPSRKRRRPTGINHQILDARTVIESAVLREGLQSTADILTDRQQRRKRRLSRWEVQCFRWRNY